MFMHTVALTQSCGYTEGLELTVFFFLVLIFSFLLEILTRIFHFMRCVFFR